MSSGHASHKGHSVKPNTNANDQLTEAADQTLDVTEFMEGGDALRAEEAPKNAAATARPENEKAQE